MGHSYERWRTSNRKAYELEQWIRYVVRPPSYRDVTRAELELAKQLRAGADELFFVAMSEIDAEVTKALSDVR